MIVDFTITNYRSIKEPVTLSALATNINEHPGSVSQSNNEKDIKLLNSLVIYGANASGKSNIIRAFNVLQDFIVNSTDLKLDEKIKYYEPFRLDTEWEYRPTEFEIEFIGEKHIRYKYELVFNANDVLRECLYFYPKKKEALLFIREKGKKIIYGSYFRGPAQSIEKQLLRNNLFLSKAANSNHKLLEEIYLYFKVKFQVNVPGSESFSSVITTQLCANDVSNVNKHNIGKFLNLADTCIDSFDIKESKAKDEKINRHRLKDLLYIEKDNLDLESIFEYFLEYKPQVYHKKYKNGKEIGVIPFDLSEESSGTIKLYDLSGIILTVLNFGSILIVDELNNSLHPLLTQHLIHLFNNPKTNPKNAQLILAIHDTTLLSPELLRRDQIWLTEKDQYGATSLFSISEFDYKKVRAEIPFDKWYLSGRFGALPVIGDFKKWFEDAQKKTDE